MKSEELVRKQIRAWLGYSEKLDMSIKNTYLILELIIYILLGWLLIDIFVLHAWDILLQGASVLVLFISVFIWLKTKRYFAAKNALLLVSLFQMYVSIFISFGADSGISNILYLIIPQAAMVYDVKVKREKAMIIFTIIATSTMMIVSTLQLPSTQEIFMQIFIAMTIMIMFSVVFFSYSKQLTQAFRELSQIASRDGLTGAHNRRAFSEMGYKRFKEGKDKPFALAIVDIDKFKNVNDYWGHPVGDIVLKHLSSTIKNSIRSKDFFARIGGEEFAIILDDVDLHSSTSVMEKLRKVIENLNIPINEKENISITVSIGISIFRPNLTDFDQLFLQSDEALYMAKNNGRNQTQAFTILE